MKKVLYSKLAKLTELLCLLVVAGVALFQCIEIAEWNRLHRNGEQNNIVDYEQMYAQIYDEISADFETLIEAHKQGGMQGLADTYYNNDEMVHKMLLVAVDSEYTYRYGLEVSPRGEDDYQYAYGYFWDSNFLNMEVAENVCLLTYENGLGELYDYYELSEYFSDSTIQYLEELEYSLYITVGVREEYFDEVELSYINMADTYEKNLEDVIYDRMPIFVVCGVVILIATILLACLCGREPENKKELNYYEKGYCEIHIGIIAGLVQGLFWGIFAFFSVYREFYNDIHLGYHRLVGQGFVVAVLLAVLWLYYELGIILKKFINKRFIKDWLVVRILLKAKKLCGKYIKGFSKWYKELHDINGYKANSSIKRLYYIKVAEDIVMLMVFTGVLLAFVCNGIGDVQDILLVLITLFIIFYIVRSVREYIHLRQYNRVIKAVDVIADGNYGEIKTAENEKNETMKKLGSMSDSFEEAIRKQVEAEKSQIELVANVSHDLKTPLTSIISYVDLLQEEEMSDVAKDYVAALVDKSTKLKDIVSDVFDLAKASSGEQVPMEQLDGVVLINQVLSDMSDIIEESGMELKLKLQVETAPIIGNGQKLYRVFQNIIDNALRYSMKGTRIYLSAESLNGEFVVVLKNVSSIEMDFVVEEILSRNIVVEKQDPVDGNGLGLAIAKSFTELCGGIFDVKIDDDVFKVIITFKQAYEKTKGENWYEKNNIL